MINDEKKKITIRVGGCTFETEETPFVIVDRVVDENTRRSSFSITVSDEVQRYDALKYTTSFDTLKLILKHKTLRSSSLAYRALNDKSESQRKGVESYASGRFITCFSHTEDELINLWTLYGGKQNEEKVMLVIPNFAKILTDVIHTDYAFVDVATDKRVFFESAEYYHTLHANVNGKYVGIKGNNTNYDIRVCISKMELFDPTYEEPDADALTKDYSDRAVLSFPAHIIDCEGSNSIEVITLDPSALGKSKPKIWKSEEESRLLLTLNHSDFSEWEYIDIRLQDAFFRNLTIVMNPWADVKLKTRIQEIIDGSMLPKDIKQTIKVVESRYTGTVAKM